MSIENQPDVNDQEIAESSGQQNNSESEGAEQSASPESSDNDSGSSEQVRDVPFHEHPRFKELVSQKNEFAERTSQLEKQLQLLQSHLTKQTSPTEPPKRDPLLNRLKEIDPEFGERFESLDGMRAQLDQFRQWQQQVEMEKVRTQAVDQISKLHEDFKVPAQFRDLYQEAIEAQALKNPNLGLGDLPNVYKAVHEKYSKLFETMRRDELKQYASNKAGDTKAPPSQPKGQAVKPGQKPKYSADPVEARRQIIDRVMKLNKASGSLGD